MGEKLIVQPDKGEAILDIKLFDVTGTEIPCNWDESTKSLSLKTISTGILMAKIMTSKGYYSSSILIIE